MSTIKVDVVSSEESLYSGEVMSVSAPASQGEIGVFPGHMALITTLKPGEVRLETESGEQSIYVAGGIIEVQPNLVTIFSDTVIRAKDLDEEKVLEAKRNAEEAMENASEDQYLSSLQATLAESMAQLQMITKMRNK
ncbi:ATP synthase epsilon chain [hydrothermal vent metagenome]|uniref:ATP synthase epsilon chain n=1 Tax=hydrothermal vent metagenome TaxID=652676 RepID=A0A1W1CWE5_9ZZZZ